jgi:D-psicose/D-tagatose/L-ribulose 3-epimerase
MRLAISNIAWNDSDETEIFTLLKERDVAGLEIAPTKYWPEPVSASKKDIRQKKEELSLMGFSIISAQALFYNHPEFSIFKDDNNRAMVLDYLLKLSALCNTLDIKVMVFGSPKNRLKGSMSQISAFEIARDFFLEVAKRISNNGVVLCFEPNPKEYGCDFIQTTLEALELVHAVNHSHFKLQLDTSAIFLTHEKPVKVIPLCFPYINHIHISEPFLSVVGESGSEHRIIAEILNNLGYDGWVSIEMRSGLKNPNKDAVQMAVDYARRVYFGKSG